MVHRNIEVGLFGLWLLGAAAETDLQKQVLSTVIYALSGDRTPEILPQLPVLTPLGATQLYNLGSQIRSMYVTPPGDSSTTGTQILDISPYQLYANDINILTTDEQFTIASAQAFMQGLYPPLALDSGYVYIEQQSSLSNGTNIVAPLNGYQYPQVESVSHFDLDSIWIRGMDECPAHDASMSLWSGSPQYTDAASGSQEFYDSLKQNILNGVFIDASVGFFDAYTIWDYLQYAAIHNETMIKYITDEVLGQARSFAEQWAFAAYADLAATDYSGQKGIRAVAGRTFASHVLRLFDGSIDTTGTMGKMNLVFGSYETMVSFASLAQLSSNGRTQFNGIPDPASVMVFELFSLFVEEGAGYPDRSNMYVRFMYRNGTDAELEGYPLFGRDNSEIIMSLDDFVTGMEAIQILGIGDWCATCNSYSVFCPGIEGVVGTEPSSGSGPLSNGGRSGLSPVIAGVIGAMVTLAVIALVGIAAMLLGGIRFFRKRTGRRSELGGFKGAEKLASDRDLTVPRGEAGATVAQAETGQSRGHERVGSWELRDSAKAEEAHLPNIPAPPFVARRPSFEDDELNVNAYNRPVKPRDQV